MNTPKNNRSTDNPRWIRILQLKYVLPFLIALVAFSYPFIVAHQQLSQIPYLEEPFDLEEFGTVELSDEDNAFWDYQRAVSLLPQYLPANATENFETSLANSSDENWEEISPVIKQWLNDNQSALNSWLVGTEKKNFLYHQPKALNYVTDFEVLQRARKIVVFASLQAKKLLSEGHLQEALDMNLAIFQYSRQLGQHGDTIERLVGIAAHGSALDSIIKWAADDRVDSNLIQQAIDRVNVEFEKTPLRSTTLKCRYFSTRNELLDPSYPEEDSTKEWKNFLQHCFGAEPEFSIALLDHFTRNYLAYIDRPRHIRDNFDLAKSGSNYTPPTNLLTGEEFESLLDEAKYAVLICGFGYIAKPSDREKSRQGILMVVLAAQKYKRDHGAFPPDSETLTENQYLSEMPLDAIQETKSEIKYLNNGDCVSVYSLWESSVDDGGCKENLTDSMDGNFGYFLRTPNFPALIEKEPDVE